MGRRFRRGTVMLGALCAAAVATALFGVLMGVLALLVSAAQPWRAAAQRVLFALYFAATLPLWALAWYCFCGSNHSSLWSFLSAAYTDRDDGAASQPQHAAES